MNIGLVVAAALAVLLPAPAGAQQTYHAFARRATFTREVWARAIQDLCPANPAGFTAYSWVTCENLLRAYRQAWPDLEIPDYATLAGYLRSWPVVRCPQNVRTPMYRATSSGGYDAGWTGRNFRLEEQCLFDNNAGVYRTSLWCWNPIPLQRAAPPPVARSPQPPPQPAPQPTPTVPAPAPSQVVVTPDSLIVTVRVEPDPIRIVAEPPPLPPERLVEIRSARAWWKDPLLLAAGAAAGAGIYYFATRDGNGTFSNPGGPVDPPNRIVFFSFGFP